MQQNSTINKLVKRFADKANAGCFRSVQPLKIPETKTIRRKLINCVLIT